MATLIRTHHEEQDIRNSIPAPFPVNLLINDVLDDLATEPVEYDDPNVARATQCQIDIQASVAAVHHSCLMTLANILSVPSLHPIAHPDDTQDPGLSISQILAESPLSCLVYALRARSGRVYQPDHPLSEVALLSQLRDLVDAISPSLSRHDAVLSHAIVDLLLDLEQLPASLAVTSAQLVSRPDPSRHNETGHTHPLGSPYETIASLQRQLSSLQSSVASTSTGSRPTPEESVRTALLWARIDQQLETVVSLYRALPASPSQPNGTEPVTTQPSESHEWRLRPSVDTLPPDYDSEYYHFSHERPPSYVFEGHSFSSAVDKPTSGDCFGYPPEKVSPRMSTSKGPGDAEITTGRDQSTASSSIDLDRITHAIERLYAVAPQLSNQRVELRKEKIIQMERAKQGKGKARPLVDVADPELDKILDLLGRASAREIPDQSVVVDPRRTAREVGTADIEEQRRKYLEHLVSRTSAGRLHSQDAVPSTSRPPSSAGDVQDTDGDHTATQHEGRSSQDGKRASYPSAPKSEATLKPSSERSRNRSSSAPHLAWLWPKDKSGSVPATKDGSSSITRTLSSDPKSPLPSMAPRSMRSLSGRLRGGSKSRPSSAGREGVDRGALDIAYVAEHHETLKHVLLFIAPVSPSSAALGGTPSAEVLASTSSGTHGDSLLLQVGGTPSSPLALPVPVVPGSKSVLPRSGHWEIKAICYQSGVPSQESEDAALLPASELSSLSPSSYTCSSCSLPLVPAPPTRYRDLPSEHWEELVDAWMCHPEGQTLAKTGMDGSDGNAKGSNFGFWPTRNETLVGGSYLLFNAQAVANGNVKCIGGRERSGNTRLAHCLCGAILGRQHERRQEDGSVSRMYRLFKYAIRPVGTVSQVPRIPMSAFVLHDMLEHVQAHATYRFVLSDEEDERPRLMVWLFKPRIRISYMLPAPALLPKSGTVDASKVLYKILGPTAVTSELKEILNGYPGFPQAEHLFYPMDVCRKLAALLKESTASYPESMRTMTGLDVGWLTVT